MQPPRQKKQRLQRKAVAAPESSRSNSTAASANAHAKAAKLLRNRDIAGTLVQRSLHDNTMHGTGQSTTQACNNTGCQLVCACRSVH